MSSIDIDRHNNMNAPRRDASQRRSSSTASRSPRLVPLSGGTRLSSTYRPRSRSLASPSLWIPPPPPPQPPAATSSTTTTTTTTHSPSLSSLSSAGGERGGRQSPPLLLPPPAAATTATTTTTTNGTTMSRRTRTCSVSTTTTTTSTTTATSSSSSSSTTTTPKKICHDARTRQQALQALQTNDDMVYLDGPAVYACQTCRTHLTTHDDIISKSFHGRRGRAFLFDSVVNITRGPPEDRLLITGLHAVCDIFCQRCRTLVGWTYQRAYEPSQKYKEGKFILEKINLYWQESSYAYADAAPPPPPPPLLAGGHRDPWHVRRRSRSHSWGGSSRLRRPWLRQDEDKEEKSCSSHYSGSMVYEYAP